MKKLVLAMACVLSLALLASCKQAASTQDVNVKNANDTQGSSFACDASFAAAFVTPGTADATTGVAGFVADTATTNQSVAFSNAEQFASISWSKSYETLDSNYTEYTLMLPYVYNSNTAATTNKASYLTYGKFGGNNGIKIWKLGDDYYATLTTDSTGDKVTKLEFTEGNPEASEFVIKSFGVWTVGSKKVSLSNVKFTRK